MCFPRSTAGKKFKVLVPGDAKPYRAIVYSPRDLRTLLSLFKADALERLSDRQLIYGFDTLPDDPDEVLAPFYMHRYEECEFLLSLSTCSSKGFTDFRPILQCSKLTLIQEWNKSFS